MTRIWIWLRCLLRGHADHLHEFTQGRLMLICVDCGRISPGWKVG